jgi:predicted nucleic acid-binding protein
VSWRAIYADTALFAYALGEPHPQKLPCVELLDAAGSGRLELHASVEVIQELLFHRLRRTERRMAIAETRDAAELCVLHDFGRAVLRRSIDLTERLPTVRGRDAVHAATALQHGLRDIVSTDAAFDGIEGLRRLEPSELLAELAV